jgi:hypothetical protein
VRKRGDGSDPAWNRTNGVLKIALFPRRKAGLERSPRCRTGDSNTSQTARGRPYLNDPRAAARGIPTPAKSARGRPYLNHPFASAQGILQVALQSCLEGHGPGAKSKVSNASTHSSVKIRDCSKRRLCARFCVLTTRHRLKSVLPVGNM